MLRQYPQALIRLCVSISAMCQHESRHPTLLRKPWIVLGYQLQICSHSSSLLLFVRLFIVPVQGIMLHLWPRSSQLPAELDLHPLQEMAGDLQVSHVRGMVPRGDIVVLQDALGVEVVHEPVALEVLIYALDIRNIKRFLDIGVPGRLKFTPEPLASSLFGQLCRASMDIP